MTVHNVYGAAENKPAEAAKPELFGNHYFIDGKIQANYRDYVPGFRSDLKSLQEGYDKAQKEKTAAKEEGYGWTTPFTWVGNIFSSLFGFIGDMFKNIFGICFDYSEAKADNADKAAENKNKPDEPKKT